MPREQTKSDEIISSLFHEIAQPLTSLRACLDLALRKPLDAAGYRSALNDAVAQQERLADILVDIRRIGEASLPPTLHGCNVARLMSDVLDTFTPVAHDKKISILSSTEVDAVIETDESKLEQLLLIWMDEALNRCSGNQLEVSVTRESGSAVVRIEFQTSGEVLGHERLSHTHIMRSMLENSLSAAVAVTMFGDLISVSLSIPDRLGKIGT